MRPYKFLSKNLIFKFDISFLKHEILFELDYYGTMCTFRSNLHFKKLIINKLFNLKKISVSLCVKNHC